MNMYKSYQFRLYPNDSQIIMIQKTFGCTRLVYNHYLEKREKEHLKYKAKYYEKRYIQIDSYYPSSQECSKCGYKNEEVKELSVRNWYVQNVEVTMIEILMLVKIYYLRE